MPTLQAAPFEAHRDRLVAVAYRMLGSRTDAEDAVQEAWLRWDAADQSAIETPEAWLTTVVSRICLDQLRSARVRREAYVGPWLPEPLVERLPAAPADDPAERATRTEEVSFALLVMLERLTPEQRVAFVLHDVFALRFDEIAAILDTSPAAARQLASRARRAVTADGAPRHTADLDQQRRVLAAFQAAAESGDIEALVAVLAPDAVAVGDGGGVLPVAARPIAGRLRVARFIASLFRRAYPGALAVRVEPVLVNGGCGLLVETEHPGGARQRGVMALAVADGQVTAVFNQLAPDKLVRVPPAGSGVDAVDLG